jgi:hypothetical protein
VEASLFYSKVKKRRHPGPANFRSCLQPENIIYEKTIFKSEFVTLALILCNVSNLRL